MFQRYGVLYRFLLLSCWAAFAQACGGAVVHEAPCDNSKGQGPKIAFSVEQVMVVSGDACPSGTRFVTHGEQLGHAQVICPKLDEWDIVRLAHGGSADGDGYHCRSRGNDERTLGRSLCVGQSQSSYQCFWMEHFSGKYAWVPAPSGFYDGQGKSRCKALDSCNGGGARSGGGCYKWSKGPNTPRQAWD
jgi:hypothetical protein